jgi:LPXTG-motif cell wall-anchored protein
MRREAVRARRVGPLAAGMLAIGLIGQMFIGASPVAAQKAGEPVELRGFATGQPAHVGAITSGGTTIAASEVAWSAAAVDADADGLKGAQLNEVNRILQPDKTGKLSYARASGLEVGLATTPADENQVILSAKAEAEAPKSSSDVQEIAVEGVDPIAYATALRGEAVANSNDSGLVPDVCVIGDDLSRGRATAADVQLLDAGGDTSAPRLDGAVVALDDKESEDGDTRSVSNSVSREKLVPSGSPNNFGLMSEVRQTIAPVTLLQGDDGDPTTPLRTITIEVLGEWVLRVVANGKSGGASVFYGPGEVSPEVGILRIIDSENVASNLLTFGDLFGEEGFTPINIDGVVQLAIGEDPRAIAAPGTNPDAESKPKIAANGTSVSAAVDVVRLNLLSQPDPQLADIRIGHMEASAEVPVGGINCPIPVDKSATDVEINVGEETTINITVDNVYNCDLEDVVLIDTISQLTGAPKFKITGTGGADDPSSADDLTAELPPGDAKQTVLEWDLGTIEQGKSKSVNFTIEATAGGELRDIAEATGTFADCSGQDATGLAIAGLDLTGLSVPVDIGIGTPQTGAGTGRTAAVGAGLAILAAGVGLFLRRRSARSI